MLGSPAVYLGVLVVWALIVSQRSSPTLWKGSSLVIVNTLFVLATIIYGVVKSDSLSARGAVMLPRSVVVFDITLVLIAVWVRRKWLLVGITYTDARQILERCFSQTRSAAVRRDYDYVVKCGELEMIVGIARNRAAIGNLHLHLPGHSIRFSGAHASRKAKLIRSLFSKQFNNSFPTPRIKA